MRRVRKKEVIRCRLNDLPMDFFRREYFFGVNFTGLFYVNYYKLRV